MSSEPASSGAGALEAGLERLRVVEEDGRKAPPPPQEQRPLVPGSTVPRHAGPTSSSSEQPAAAAVAEHTWGPATASEFAVRAVHYRRLNRKEASLESFYELVAFDLIQTPRGPVDHIARGMDLAALAPFITHPALPPLFLVNCQLPDAEPAMFGTPADDGPGRSAVFVFAVRPETVAALNDAGATKEPALQLLVDYFRRAPADPDFRGRFKVIASGRNIEELALPSFITNYNGKPVLITKSGRLWQGAGYVEMDIRVHRFSFLAKKGLAALKGRFARMDLLVGFIVEGRGDEELPERLLGCARLHRLSYDRAAPEGVLPGGLLVGGDGGAGNNGRV